MTTVVRAGNGHGHRSWGLAILAVCMAGVATLLWQVDGPPRLLEGLPDTDRVRAVLGASQLAPEDAIAIVATLGWLVIGYLGLAVTLRVAVVACSAATSGASWTRVALVLSNAVTLPAVRRMVDGAVAGTLLVASLAPAATYAAGATTSVSTGASIERPRSPQDVAQREAQQAFRYTVQPGDTLFKIAQRIYEDGTRYPEIFAANEGRMMADGGELTDADLIRVGWTLEVPLPAPRVGATLAGTLRYQVSPGDSLWRIAERLLGDGFRWTEVFALNEDHTMADGTRLVDPSRISPGWWLDLPVTVVDRSRGGLGPPPSPATPPVATPEPAPPVTEPEAASHPSLDDGQGEGRSVPLLPVQAVALTAAGFALIGGVVVLVRRLRPLRLPSLPVWRHQQGDAGDAGRVVLTTRSLAVALADLGFTSPRALLAVESPRWLTVTLECDPGDADALANARYDLGRRLGSVVGVEPRPQGRVDVRLTHLGHFEAIEGDVPRVAPLFVPVGASDDGIVYLNLAAAGSACVVGPLAERSRLLRAWAETLESTCAPEAITVRTAAERGATPLMDGSALVADLEAEVASRSAGGNEPPVIGLCEVGSGAPPSAHALVRYGPSVNVYPVYATGDAEYLTRHDFGAVVEFGATLEAEADEGQEDGVHHGHLRLRLSDSTELMLEPIRVRVDDSPRWQRPATKPPSASDDDDEPTGPGPEPDDPEGDGPGEGGSGAVDAEDRPVEVAPDDDAVEAAAIQLPDAEPAEPLRRTAPVALREDPAARSPVAVASEEAPRVAASAPAAVRQATLLVDAPDDDDEGDARAPVIIRCLGQFEVECRGQPLPPPRLHKARELLAFLAVRGGGNTSRDAVVGALWPDLMPDDVGSQLHDATHRLRRMLRDGVGKKDAQYVVVAAQQYRLELSRFHIDLDAFEASERRAANLSGAEALAEYERALEICRGELLAGEAYEWAEDMRREYHRRRQEVARAAGEAALAAGDATRARRHYQIALECDPIDEAAVRGLMRAQALLRDPTGARKVYRTFTEALRQEMDDETAEPTPETADLLHEIVGRAGASA